MSKERELSILDAKRNVLFERIQGIYERLKIVHASEVDKEAFLSYCTTVNNIKQI